MPDDRSTHILGISCFGRDSAAVLLRGGEIIAAAQEERFTRVKHDGAFPLNAARYCLSAGGLAIDALDAVACAASGPGHDVKECLRYSGSIVFVPAAESYAAGAFFPSPLEKAAIVAVGCGRADDVIGMADGNALSILSRNAYPHSLGFLYSVFTEYLGFEAGVGEYKVMGLAPYGEPVWKRLILDSLIDARSDGSFALSARYFDASGGVGACARALSAAFGFPAREQGSNLTRQHLDVAASVQQAAEEVMLATVRHAHAVTGMRSLCLSGELALNCAANGRIAREGPFNTIWIQPAASEAGAALGAAFFVLRSRSGAVRVVDGRRDAMKSSLLGPSFGDDEIEDALQKEGAAYARLAPDSIAGTAAKLIASGALLGWFQGRMEFGPRALGSRSIIGDPRDASLHERLNLRVKRREPFRPFAPSVLAGEASRWFDLDTESPYMLLTVPVARGRRRQLSAVDLRAHGLDRLRIERSEIPAVTHVDYSARVQTVRREDNPLYFDLISSFHKLTGCPVVINTSFNVRGEPLVCSPEDAYRCFMSTGLDYLIIGSFLLEKRGRPLCGAG